jgi:hypothetical protein
MTKLVYRVAIGTMLVLDFVTFFVLQHLEDYWSFTTVLAKRALFAAHIIFWLSTPYRLMIIFMGPWLQPGNEQLAYAEIKKAAIFLVQSLAIIVALLFVAITANVAIGTQIE